jgi:3-hydroxymyristoyl/3-hydroxydecanoyl-(acyl carrier protein) dehydratase
MVQSTGAAERAESAFALDSRTVKMFMPHRHAMALLDCVEQCCLQERRLRGYKNVARNEPVLIGHFPDDPVFPPSLIVEALAQAAGCLMNLLFLFERGIPIERLTEEAYVRTVERPPLSVLAESRVKQTGMARPGDRLFLNVRVTLRRGEISAFTVEAETERGKVAHGELILAYPSYVPIQKQLRDGG